MHGGVGGGEQGGAVAAIVGVEGDAYADADVAGFAAGQADRVRDAAPDAVGEIVGVPPRVHRIGDDDELVAADPRPEILLPQGGLDPFRQGHGGSSLREEVWKSGEIRGGPV